MSKMNEKNFSTSITANEQDVVYFYNQYADCWDNRFGNKDLPSTAHFLARRLNSFLEIIGSINFLSEKRVAELGVGTGIYLEKLSGIFDSIIAVDGSQKMIERLKIRLEKSHLSNITAMVASVSNIPNIDDDSIDIIYFFGLIEHIIDKNSFVKEINRILKPGGSVVGITPNGKSPWYKIRVLARGTGKHCSSDHYYTKGELKNLFELHGLVWEKHKYWGLVYAGLSHSFFYKALSFLEPILEKSPFSFLLGGITFKVSKAVTHTPRVGRMLNS